jgi:hypothetical protein
MLTQPSSEEGIKEKTYTAVKGVWQEFLHQVSIVPHIFTATRWVDETIVVRDGWPNTRLGLTPSPRDPMYNLQKHPISFEQNLEQQNVQLRVKGLAVFVHVGRGVRVPTDC